MTRYSFDNLIHKVVAPAKTAPRFGFEWIWTFEHIRNITYADAELTEGKRIYSLTPNTKK